MTEPEFRRKLITVIEKLTEALESSLRPAQMESSPIIPVPQKAVTEPLRASEGLYTQQQVREQLIAYMKVHGTEITTKLVQDVTGAEHLSDISEEKYASLMKELAK